MIGVSNFDRGQRANVETAAEANQIGAGASIQKSRIQAKVEEAWTEVARISHRAMLQVEDDRKFVVPIVGDEEQEFLSQSEVEQGFATVTLGDLQGEFDYFVKANSTLPLDMNAKFVRAAGVYQAVGGPQSSLVNQREVVRDLVTLADQDAYRWVPGREQMKQQAQMESAQTEDAAGGEAQVAQNSLAPLMALQGK